MDNTIKYITECDSVYGVVAFAILCICIVVCVIAIAAMVTKFDDLLAEGKEGKFKMRKRIARKRNKD